MTDSVHELNAGNPQDVASRDIVFDCPSCHKSLVVDQVAAGHQVPCPKCGQNIPVPQVHRVVTLDEAPETGKIQAMPQWKQDLIHIEASLKEASHQRQEAGNQFNQHVSEANRLKLRIEKLDARLKELQTQRDAIKAAHPEG
ncbi:MAG: hypothetical protein PHV34_13775 [Verrucomicrobiae bacterium]|nr:hypothetical protein [Verrucomicrobiae bacterium]